MSDNVLAREDIIHQNFVEYNEKIKEFYSLKVILNYLTNILEFFEIMENDSKILLVLD